jgi:hypothetical protein
MFFLSFLPTVLSVLFLLPVLLCLCLRLFHSVYVTVRSVRTRLAYFITWSSVISSTIHSRPVSLRANEICYTYKGAWPLLIATSIIISLSRPLTLRESGKVSPAAHNVLYSHYIKILRRMLAAETRVRLCEWHEVGGWVAFWGIWLHPVKLPAPPSFTSKVTDECEDSRRKPRASPRNFHNANQFPKSMGWGEPEYLLANLRFIDRPKIFRMEEYML